MNKREKVARDLLNEKMKTSRNTPYLFLISWFDSCESGSWIKTKVHNPKHLYEQLKKNNEHIKAVVIEAPSEEIALSWGYRWCFFHDMTAHETVSNCFLITPGVRRVLKRVMPNHVPVIVEL
jgi:hypothetical protein